MALRMPPAFFQFFSEEQIFARILAGHDKERLAKVALLLGKGAGLAGDDLIVLLAAALLHDIGKIYIPLGTLLGDGPLQSNEREWLEKHPARGADLLIKLGFPGEVAEVVLSHHENWDGSGYPRGIQGKEIPLKARIVRVVDSYDAMLTTRSYQLPKNPRDASLELFIGSGKEYDPEIIDLLPKIFAIH